MRKITIVSFVQIIYFSIDFSFAFKTKKLIARRIFDVIQELKNLHLFLELTHFKRNKTLSTLRKFADYLLNNTPEGRWIFLDMPKDSVWCYHNIGINKFG